MKLSNNQYIKKDIPEQIQIFVTVWYAFVANSLALFLYSIYGVLISLFDGYKLDQILGFSIINIIIYFVLFMETIPLSTLFLSFLHYFKIIEYCIYSKAFVAIESVAMMILSDIYYSHFYMNNRFYFFTVAFIISVLIFLVLKYIFPKKYDIITNKFISKYSIDGKKDKWHKILESVVVFTILLIWTVISAYMSPN